MGFGMSILATMTPLARTKPQRIKSDASGAGLRCLRLGG